MKVDLMLEKGCTIEACTWVVWLTEATTVEETMEEAIIVFLLKINLFSM